MATDGVKIIDGDLAADIYGTFMEMYDAGSSIAEIKAAVEEQYDEGDGFDYEIYITVFALAQWQTGQLSSDVIPEVDAAIARGAGVKVWIEEYGVKEGQKRQRELEKLREKLALPNPKIRKRRIYKLITKFVFEENAVLVFQLPNGNYCATILATIMQHQERCHYYFIASTYKGPLKPSVDDIKNADIIGRKKPLGFGNYGVWLDATAIGPKLLRSFKNKFEQIGELEIKAIHKDIGSIRRAQDFESFCRTWENTELSIKHLEGTTFHLKELL